jgi:hypothetical protein
MMFSPKMAQMQHTDDIADTLTPHQVHMGISDITQYLEEIVGDDAWICETTRDDKETVRVRVAGNEAVVRIRGGEKVTACDGLMRSPLEPNDHPVYVKLQTFSDLLDYMILHLCPSMCIPRAIYHVVHALQLSLPAVLVEEQIVIDEIAGEFTLENQKCGISCKFRMRLNEQGQPALHYDPNQELPVPSFCGEPLEGFDFVQHAFMRVPDTKYMQHPHVAQALSQLLHRVGLSNMDAALQREAMQLIAGVAEHEKVAAEAVSSRSGRGAGG